MNYPIVVFSLIGSIVCLASSPAPYKDECRLLERLTLAESDSSLALQLLQRVALGRTIDISPEEEIRMGLARGQLQNKNFAAATVRGCALQRIGELGSLEAVSFLSELSQAKIGPDSTELWSATQVALWTALLARIVNDSERILFLEEMLAKPHDGLGTTWMWAINQLCDRGSLTSLGIIQRSVRNLWSGPYAEGEIRFCESRMRVIAGNPDRVKAIGAILDANRGEADDDRLLSWAVYQLTRMRHPNADAELRRFASEVEHLANSSPKKPRLDGFLREIRGSMTVR